MRGSSQSHLLATADNTLRVVKFSNNPQGCRTLVNEWIASTFLRELGIATPEVKMVRVTDMFLRQNPEIYIQFGMHREPPKCGLHLGSRVPVDPLRCALYDFLPDSQLEIVENLADFRGALVFDKWIGNTDSRQAIFFRGSLREGERPVESHPLRLGFVAQMVDNSHVFNGSQWRFQDLPLDGLYFRRSVYRGVRGLGDFQPWLGRILDFPEETVKQTAAHIPPEWLEGEEHSLQQTLEVLMDRRKRLPSLMEECRYACPDVFPNWTCKRS